MRRRLLVLLLMCGILAVGIATGVPPHATTGVEVWRPAVGSDSVPRSIEEAERLGSRHPRSTDPVAFQKRWLNRAAVATEDRTCVVVDSANSARSGEIIGANFRAYIEWWSRGAPPKLAWGAGHRPAISEPVQLILTASRLDEPAPSHVLVGEVTTYQWSAVALARLLRMQWFEAAVIDPPMPGRWLLVARVGVNWGCFVLDLRERTSAQWPDEPSTTNASD